MDEPETIVAALCLEMGPAERETLRQLTHYQESLPPAAEPIQVTTDLALERNERAEWERGLSQLRQDLEQEQRLFASVATLRVGLWATEDASGTITVEAEFSAEVFALATGAVAALADGGHRLLPPRKPRSLPSVRAVPRGQTTILVDENSTHSSLPLSGAARPVTLQGRALPRLSATPSLPGRDAPHRSKTPLLPHQGDPDHDVVVEVIPQEEHLDHHHSRSGREQVQGETLARNPRAPRLLTTSAPRRVAPTSPLLLTTAAPLEALDPRNPTHATAIVGDNSVFVDADQSPPEILDAGILGNTASPLTTMPGPSMGTREIPADLEPSAVARVGSVEWCLPATAWSVIPVAAALVPAAVVYGWLAMGHFQAARTVVELAATLDQRSTSHRRWTISPRENLETAGGPAPALAHYYRARLIDQAENGETLLTHPQARRQQRRLAREHLTAATKVAPANPWYWLSLARLSSALKEPAETQNRLWQRVHNLPIADPEYWRRVADRARVQGKWESAVTAYRKVLMQSPQQTEEYLAFLVSLGHSPKEYLAIVPDLPVAALQAARFLKQAHDDRWRDFAGNALTQIERAAKTKEPEDFAALSALYHLLDRLDDAIRAVEAARQRQPGRPDFDLQLAELRYAREEYDESLTLADDVLKAEPAGELADKAQLLREKVALASRGRDDVFSTRKQGLNTRNSTDARK